MADGWLLPTGESFGEVRLRAVNDKVVEVESGQPSFHLGLFLTPFPSPERRALRDKKQRESKEKKVRAEAHLGLLLHDPLPSLLFPQQSTRIASSGFAEQTRRVGGRGLVRVSVASKKTRVRL